jgi:hypothetical protein
MSEVVGVNIGADFESVAKKWLGKKKFKYLNVCTAAMFWTL